MARKILIAALVVLLLASAGLTAAVASKDDPPVVKPNLSADGKYTVGTVGDDAGVAATRAASRALPVALSYDYRSLDKSLEKATALMTPSFARSFRSTFDKTTRAMATDKHAIEVALVHGAGLVRGVHGGRATVLVYLDQVLVSSKAKKASDPLKVSQNRVHVSMLEVGGRWLVDDVEPF
jgi:Mce-associated membrane protein